MVCPLMTQSGHSLAGWPGTLSLLRQSNTRLNVRQNRTKYGPLILIAIKQKCRPGFVCQVDNNLTSSRWRVVVSSQKISEEGWSAVQNDRLFLPLRINKFITIGKYAKPSTGPAAKLRGFSANSVSS
jgi:hypothetical protein